MSQLPKAQIDQLQAFVTLLKARPAMLHDPGLQFFRDYLISLGAKLPSPPPEEEKKPEKFVGAHLVTVAILDLSCLYKVCYVGRLLAARSCC